MSFDTMPAGVQKRAGLDAVDVVNRYLDKTAGDDYAQAFAAFVIASIVGAYPPDQQAQVRTAIAGNVDALLVDSNRRMWKTQ